MKLKNYLKKIYALQFRQIKLYCGESKKQVKYVIRFFPKEGLMSMLYKACGHVEYALDKGYIPVIDMKHFRTIYRTCGWSDFFDLRNVGDDAKSCNYIISSAGSPKDAPLLFGEYWAYAFENFAEKGKWFWEHFSVNKDIMQMVEEEVECLDIDNCIGMLLRGD